MKWFSIASTFCSPRSGQLRERKTEVFSEAGRFAWELLSKG
jgi:hypothetical protein